MRMTIVRCFWLSLGLLFSPLAAHAQSVDNEGFGQSIQINTRLSSFVGKPIWSLIIRDLDNGENLPYIFDLRRGNNFWIAFTFSHHYLITVSRLQIVTYQSRTNTSGNYRVTNFCHLESNGHIMRGQSMVISIEGDLSPDSNTYTCHVTTFPDSNFTIVNQNDL